LNLSAVRVSSPSEQSIKSSLQILHLEDEANDAALIQRTLKAGGIACAITRVETREAFVAALERDELDLILSDYALPDFDGLAALGLAHARRPEVPFILVSGTLGEDLAIEAFKSGSTDYVLKERLTRLVPAVERAMEEVDARAERRRLEGQFIEAQKMKVLGQLAGGVAHDFNNILGVIMGYSDMITSDLPADSPLRKYNEEIRLASERAAGLTRQLLVFSRKQTVQAVVLDLNVVVQEQDGMLRRLIGENIALTMALGEGAGSIRADPGYVGQILMNLVVNARDAMPSGGQLTISTEPAVLAAGPLPPKGGARPGSYAVLSVKDTGSGMTDAVKTHLFEAFFTTKPSGQGTGLGLATCQTIVQQSGGFIDVDSEVGQGATFKIYFPQVEPSGAAAVRPVTAAPPPRGTETVLIVEDEPSVRHLARSFLASQGYDVLAAANGQEALHVARDHRGAPIRLVVTDVIMPLMGGKVMAEWLKATYPGIRILFTSGYTDDTITHLGVLEEGVEFLPKPYTPATLCRRVRELLDAPGAAAGA
jgi:two-component system cell cycle sensor histidine kinase/response regulator CckA